ncbi:hypothetical protein BRC81_02065 [Halobacteriales archaeon QS_1_68_20]|nr:MAG: hypothetical protein BRC81_02065 [Halobacteriales archaeon QS_1_68_20]
MSRIFVAGPIDYRPLNEVVDYRLRLADLVREEGHSLVDQYSGALERVADIDFGGGPVDLDEIRDVIASLPDEPYVEALRHAIDEHSLLAVVQSPGLVPEEMPPEIVEALVHRDLELVEEADAVLAYLPRPSCGTTAEIVHAHDLGLPIVVVSEEPPTFIRYYADEVLTDEADAIAALEDYV